jgi:hypothetical protein
MIQQMDWTFLHVAKITATVTVRRPQSERCLKGRIRRQKESGNRTGERAAPRGKMRRHCGKRTGRRQSGFRNVVRRKRLMRRQRMKGRKKWGIPNPRGKANDHGRQTVRQQGKTLNAERQQGRVNEL